MEDEGRAESAGAMPERAPHEAGRATQAGTTAFLAVNGWILGFCLLYLVSAMVLPKPAYVPLEHRWTLEPRATGPVMVYYGQLLWGLAGGLAGAALGAIVARRFRPGRDAFILLVGWTAALAAFTFTFCAVQVFA